MNIAYRDMPKTIILADDSATIRKIVELTFTGTDIRVESFGSGAAALEHLDTLEEHVPKITRGSVNLKHLDRVNG